MPKPQQHHDLSAPRTLGENLGKRLTHVDAAVRERTVEALAAWMRDREKVVGVIDNVELLQLWKGKPVFINTI